MSEEEAKVVEQPEAAEGEEDDHKVEEHESTANFEPVVSERVRE
jgi:hypothetical protein